MVEEDIETGRRKSPPPALAAAGDDPTPPRRTLSRRPTSSSANGAATANGNGGGDDAEKRVLQRSTTNRSTSGGSSGGSGGGNTLTAQGAAKAGQFIQLCDQAGVALLFLHNTTGFLVGTEPERAGIIKHGSKMIQAVANARVPKLSVVIGGSYGAGNYAMCGRGFDPRFLFAWPNARTSVMGPAQAGQVMRIVTEAKMRAEGAVDAARLDALEQGTAAALAEQTTALASSARLEDDGIIDPRQTREVLALVLGLIAGEGARVSRGNTFGVARL